MPIGEEWGDKHQHQATTEEMDGYRTESNERPVANKLESACTADSGAQSSDSDSDSNHQVWGTKKTRNFELSSNRNRLITDYKS